MTRIVVDHINGVPQNGYIGGKPTTIVLHEVANQTSTLENEVAYMKGHWQDAFVQYLVNWDHAVEAADPNFIAWGAGPNVNGYAIHIELVRDNGKNFTQAYNNWLDLAVELADRYGISKTFNKQRSGIVTHHWVSDNLGGTDHTDPDGWLAVNGVSLSQLAADINNRSGGDMQLDKRTMDSMQLRYMGRMPLQGEYDGMLGKVSFGDYLNWVENNPDSQIWNNICNTGRKATAYNWEKQINDLTTEVATLKQAQNYEQITDPVYKKKTA